MLDYSKEQQHERDHLLNIMNTVYPNSVFTMIESADSIRKPEEDSENRDLIEITTQMKEVIDQVTKYKSRFNIYEKYSNIRSSNRDAQS